MSAPSSPGVPRRRSAASAASAATVAAVADGTVKGGSGERVRVSRELLEVPPVAWPTIALFLASVGLQVASHWLALTGRAPQLLCSVLSAVSLYLVFTPLHDATHRSVAKGVPALNEVVGQVSCAMLNAPFATFRFVHLNHHKYTNDPDKDPDFWAARGPKLLLPLRWLTQEYHYYGPYLASLGSRPLVAEVEVFTTMFVLLGLHRQYVLHLGWSAWLLNYFFPKTVAAFVLAFFFDYVPHRPHLHKRVGTNSMKSTAKLGGLLTVCLETADWLNIPLLGQGDHMVHHHSVSVPWYRYNRIWRAHRDDFLAAGMPVHAAYEPKTPWW